MEPTFDLEYIPCDFCGAPVIYKISTKGQLGMKDDPGYICEEHLSDIINLDIETQVANKRNQNVQDLLETDWQERRTR